MGNMGIEYNTIVMTFGYPVAGRESQAGELYASRAAYLERCKQAGRLQSWAMHCLHKTGFLNAFSGKAASDILSQWAKAARS